MSDVNSFAMVMIEVAIESFRGEHRAEWGELPPRASVFAIAKWWLPVGFDRARCG